MFRKKYPDSACLGAKSTPLVSGKVAKNLGSMAQVKPKMVQKRPFLVTPLV